MVEDTIAVITKNVKDWKALEEKEEVMMPVRKSIMTRLNNCRVVPRGYRRDLVVKVLLDLYDEVEDLLDVYNELVRCRRGNESVLETVKRLIKNSEAVERKKQRVETPLI